MTTINSDTLKSEPARRESEFNMHSGSASPDRSAVPAAHKQAPAGIITVQPLRRSEMQPSYAQVSLIFQPDDMMYDVC